MKKEDLTKRFNELGKCETVEEMRTKMVEFQKEVETDYDAHDVTVSDLAKANEDKAKLQKHNMDLYLKVSAQENDVDKGKDKNPGTEELTYENLFNEQGGLK